MSWLWLSVAIVLEVFATLSLRASEGLRRPWWAVPVALGYAAAFSCLALALAAGMPVAVAYGVWSAVGVALVALVARAVWDEPMTPRMVAGIVLIGAGVLLIELG